jgi:hypothetical protein
MHPASIALLCCASTLVSCAGPEAAPGAERSFTLGAGAVSLDSDNWSDERGAASLAWSMRDPAWPCGLEMGVQYAAVEWEDESVSRTADLFDIRCGVTGTWWPATWLQLVAGAGPRLSLAQTSVPATFTEVSEQAASFGLYAHTGAFVRIHSGFSIGVDAQVAAGSDYDLAGEDRAAQMAGLFLALRWDF